jgi:hypothetical protein
VFLNSGQPYGEYVDLVFEVMVAGEWTALGTDRLIIRK